MSRGVNSRAFLTGFKETLSGHFFGVSGIIAGLIVAWQLGVFRSVSWAVAVYPTVLTAKGVMNALFSGRLNTALHVGTVSPRFSGNMRNLGLMYQRILALTLATSVVISIASTVLGCLFWGVAPESFVDILIVVVATMSLGLTTYLLSVPITFSAFKKGLDLDGVAYPIAATIADIMITLCYALTINLFGFGYEGKYAVALIAVLAVAFMVYSLRWGVHRERFVQAIKSSFSALMVVAVIASVTGAVLMKINLVTSNVNGSNTLQSSTLFTAYPALIELVSDAALVIGSTATTRLVLGLLKPNTSAVGSHSPQILGAWTASAIAFVFVSAASLLLTGTFNLSAFRLLTSILLVTNVFAIIAMTLISYAFAVLTFTKGLDPDHLVVPLQTSLAGVITSTALLAALILL